VERITRWIPIVVVAAAAVLVLFPLSVYPTLFHRTPNSPLHWMVLDHIMAALSGDVDDMARVVAADFPAGRPVRIIGWPVQIMALPFVSSFGRVGALNIALLISVVLSGVLMTRVLARFGLSWVAQAVGGLAWVTNPLMVSFLSNGQYENHVGFALPLAMLGVLRSGIVGELMMGAGLLLAAFSSPYQVIPAAIVVTAMVAMSPDRRLGGLTFVLVCVLSCCYWYYTGPQPQPGGECGPTSGTMPLVIAELFGFTGAIDAEMPFRPDRWSSFGATIADPIQRTRSIDVHNLNVAPGSGYLGIVPLVLGAVGLWRVRETGWSRPLAVGAMGCAILALGPELSVVRGSAINLPLPADVFGLFPGLSQMGTTLRFMSGAAFVMVVGLAFFVHGMRNAGRWAVVVVIALFGDWALGTVSDVPMRARSYRLPAGFDALPDEGAVITVPIQERVSPEAHLWMGAILERDVVGYCDQSIKEYAKAYSIIDYVQGGRPPESAMIRSDFSRLRDAGIGYVAFMVAEPGADRFKRAAQQLTFAFGSPDAVGDGIIGYRTDRSSPEQ